MNTYPLRDESGALRKSGIDISELRDAIHFGIWREQSGIERMMQAHKGITCDMSNRVLPVPTTMVIIQDAEAEVVAIYAAIGDESDMFLCYSRETE